MSIVYQKLKSAFWVTLHRKVNEIYWLNSPQQESQRLCSEKAEFRSYLVNRKGKEQSDKPQLGMLEIREQNSNRMGLSPLHRLSYPTPVPQGQATQEAWTLSCMPTQPMIIISSLSLWSTMALLTLCPDLGRKLAQEGSLTLALSFNHKCWLKINNSPSFLFPFLCIFFSFFMYFISFMLSLVNRLETI